MLVIPPRILPIPKKRLDTSTVLPNSSVYVMLDAVAVLEAARAVMIMLEKYIIKGSKRPAPLEESVIRVSKGSMKANGGR